MNDNFLKILAVGIADSDAEIKEKFEKEFNRLSATILIFDGSDITTDGIFDPNYPSDMYINGESVSRSRNFTKSRLFNTDLSQQLANVLIQEHERRTESHALFFHDNLHVNHMLWKAIQNFLVVNEINSVVFMHQLKNLIEAILYQVAKAMDLQTLVLVQSVFHNRFFSCRSLSDFGNFDRTKFSEHFQLPGDIDNYAHLNNCQDRLENQDSILRNVGKICLFLLNIRSIKIFDPMYIIKRAKNLNDAPDDITDWKDPFAYFFYTSKKSYFEFITNEFDMSTINNQRYVYFPLQAIRDLYSEVLLNRFSDQILAIEQLSRIVPEDCKIFVKCEDQGNSDYLTPMWFHRLRRISNVIYVPCSVNSNLLLENCEIVSTVSSQQGWKAMAIGKKVLVFGKPWYRNLTGVYLYRADLTYDTIFNSKFRTVDFSREINSLIVNSHEGDLNQFIQHESKFICQKTNSENLATTITRLLSGEFDTTFQPNR